MKLSKSLLLLIACLYFLTGTVTAQKSLEKPYQKWSKEEAIKILNDSPWVKTYQSTEAMAAAEAQQIARDQAEGNVRRAGTVGTNTRAIAPKAVVVRLHSGLPVRQALIRLRQIGAGYDKWDEQKRAEFDNSAKNYIECSLCKDYYIVTMAKIVSPNSPDVEDGLFQTMKLEDLKGKVKLLNDKGEERELFQFTPPKNAGDFAVFFFARRDDKKNELLTPQSNDFKITFTSEFFSAANPYSTLLPRTFEFKTSKLLIGEKLEF